MAPRSQIFYTIRHGERLDYVDKDWVADPGTIVPDPPLTSHGRSQAVLTGSYLLTTLGPTHRVIIYASPFKRCVETALGIAQGLSGVDTNCKDVYGSGLFPPSPPREKMLGNLPILRLEPGLGEWLNTEWFNDIPTSRQMCSWRIDELARNSRELREYCSIDWFYKPVCDQWVFPELVEEMDNRLKDTKEGIEKAIQKEEGDVVIIFVTHGGGVNSLLLAFKGRHEIVETGYCCISRTRWIEGATSDAWNGSAGKWKPSVNMDDDDEAWGEVGGNDNYISGQMNPVKNGCGGGKWVVDMEASMAHIEGMKSKY